MIISFSDYPLEKGKNYQEATLSILTDGKKVEICIDNFERLNTTCTYEISKEQLKEFIGALLHVQSKIR